jgi:hypothetical protein
MQEKILLRRGEIRAALTAVFARYAPMGEAKEGNPFHPPNPQDAPTGVVDMIKSNIAIASILLTAMGSATASEVTGTVNTVIQRASDGLTYVLLNGTATTRPGCATGTSYYMLANENSEAGKKQFAMLLLAKASGLRVRINGANQCTRWSDGEDLNELFLID